MKIGAVYPQIELKGDPEGVAFIGCGIETLGYDHLLMYDHVVGAVHEDRHPPLWAGGPYTDKDPFHDPLVTFAYLAGITKRIELVTGVLILPQRQTVLVAKQCADIDLFSQGRFRLGVGTGWNYVEYDALGQSFASRGLRLTEQIGYLRRLWAEPLVSYHGSFDRMDRGNILPRPKRKIPIYCGGFAELAYKRAANLADGFIFAGSLDGNALPGWQRIKQLLAAADRPIAAFGAHYNAQENGRGLAPSQLVTVMQRWQDAGGTHASIVSMGLGFTSAAQHLNYFSEVHAVLTAAGLM